MTQVVITGPPVITGAFTYDGITFYGWTFPVIVDGQAGVYTIWVDTEDPDAEPGIEEDLIEEFENDPGAVDGLEGIAQGDGPADGAGVEDGFPDGDFGDDGDDGALADAGDTFGESV